ncbi:MAG: EamA family transporter [Deltaproteobacteria bacterium]|nr:EamA family transporter [Deltaproteobacteria bacterium]
MGPEFLALTSSVAWGSEAILVRRGSRYASVALAALMGFVLSTVGLWTAIWLYFPLSLLYTDATWYFIISGLIQPAIVRFMHYTGIVRLGASRAGPVRSVTPLFAIALAFTFLGERPEAAVYLGSLLSVVGVWFTSSRREGESEWKAIHLAYPLGAAFLTAISQNFRKTGLLIMPNPYVATAVTITTSLVVFSLSLVATGQLRATFQGDRKCLPFYGAAAVVSATAQLLGYIALSEGDVSVVVPLINTNPLFIVLFSALFLRDLETINARVAAGAVLIVTGIALITYR